MKRGILGCSLVIGVLVGAGCADRKQEAVEARSSAVISDQVHSGGTKGFFFLAPMVKQPTLDGVFASGLSPVVRIDDYDASAHLLGTLATFTTTTGPGSETVRETADPLYIVNWHIGDFTTDPSHMYRINVLVGGRVLGFADVDLVLSNAEAKRVDTNEYIPLVKDGKRTLPIKFWINKCGPVVCTASDQCHAAGVCDATTGVCSNPAKDNGTACSDGNACTRADTCQTGACVGADPVVCTASDQCHAAGVCDPAAGTCSTPAAPDGTACLQDGEAGKCSAAACTLPPRAPGTGSLPLPPGATTKDTIDVGPTTVCTALGTAGIECVDLSDPAHPAVTGALPAPPGGDCQDLTLIDDVLYAACGDGGVMCVHVDQHTFSPTLLHLLPRTRAKAVQHIRDALYVATDGGPTYIYDATIPDSPVDAGVVQPRCDGAGGLWADDDVLYCIMHDGGLAILATGGGTSGGSSGGSGGGGTIYGPLLVGTVPFPGGSGGGGGGGGFVSSGGIGYWPLGTGGLGIFDLRDPGNPVQVGYDPTPTSACDVSGTLLLCTSTLPTGTGAIRIIDVSDPRDPRPVTTNHPTAPPTAPKLTRSRLAICAHSSTWAILDVPPVVAATSPPDGTAGLCDDGHVELELTALLDPATITSSTVSVRRAGVAVAGSLTVDQNLVTFLPASPLVPGDYEISVLTGAIKNTRGTPGPAQGYTGTFSVVAACVDWTTTPGEVTSGQSAPFELLVSGGAASSAHVLVSKNANPAAPFAQSVTVAASAGAPGTFAAGWPAPDVVEPTTYYAVPVAVVGGVTITGPTTSFTVSPLVCAAGRGDCDGNSANACETSLLADAANCGACGVTCAAGAVCQAGQCVTSACGGDGAVARWRFDDAAGTATDSIGGANGVFQGDAAYGGGAHPATAGNVDSLSVGSSSVGYVEVSSRPALEIPGSFTVSAWVRLTSQSALQNIVSKEDGGTASTNYNLHVYDNHPAFVVTFPSGNGFSSTIHADAAGTFQSGLGFIVSSSDLFVDAAHPLGTWRLVTGQWDAAARALRVYVDCQPAGQAIMTAAPSVYTASDPLRIGKRSYAGTGDLLRGNVDDVRIWNRALQPTEVAGLATAGGVCAAGGPTACGLACVDTSADPANCGACGHSCGGAACAAGVCGPAVVGSVPAGIEYFTADSGKLYWGNYLNGQVQSLAVGGALTTLATGANGAQASVLRDGFLYVTTYAHGGGSLLKIPQGGGAATNIATGLSGVDSLVTDGTYWYVGSYDGGLIYRVPYAGGAATVWATGVGGVSALAFDGTDIYVAVFSGAILRVPVATGVPQVVVPNANAYDVRVDGSTVYFTTFAGELKEFPRGGGAVTSYGNISGMSYTPLALDGDFIYLLSYGTGGLWRIAKHLHTGNGG